MRFAVLSVLDTASVCATVITMSACPALVHAFALALLCR